MPREITMPQQSDTMTEGVLVSWNVKEGDKYAEGDIVAEIETDKATMEMEGPDEPGTVAAILVRAGDKVPVGATLAVIATEGEDVEAVRKAAGGKRGQEKKSAKPSADEGEEEEVETSTDQQEEEQRVPAEAATAGATASAGAQQKGTASNGRSGNGSTRIKASPLARRIAENAGIDLARVTGSGPGGRIVQKDVLSIERRGGSEEVRPREAATTPVASQRPAPKMPERVASGKSETVELSKMRQAIAKQLVASKQNLPHFYETIDIELDAAESLRSKLNETLEAEGIRISLGDLIAKAVAATLKVYPVLNSTFDGTTLTRHGDVHLGMAVALDNGLIVPVLRNIDQMGLREIRVRSVELVEKARAQKLKNDEMKGATFTVSNLGSFGVREFVAIINPPEVGILAIGAGAKRAVVDEHGKVVARTVMSVTLSADHRVVDGADSARFLATLKQMLEEPGMMLA